MRRSRSNSLRSHASFEHDAKNALFWGLGQLDTIRERAAELAALAPDVISASGHTFHLTWERRLFSNFSVGGAGRLVGYW